MFKRLRAFTLAEVLITLGIIGVVAAMTIPTLMSNYREKVVLTRMQKFYSTFNQALMRSEADNGDMKNWTLGGWYDYDSNRVFYETYLKGYVNVTKTQNQWESLPVNGYKLYFADGSSATIAGDFVVYKPKAESGDVYGKDVFVFRIMPDYATAAHDGCKSRMAANGCDWTRSDLIDGGSQTCTSSASRWNCAALIMNDNWQIADDYPIRF